MYKAGQEVKIKRDGVMLKALLLQPVDFDVDVAWWVQYTDNGMTDVTIINERELDYWNGEPGVCTCGSTKVNSLFHSRWCDAYNS